jgi:hypothetical protein
MTKQQEQLKTQILAVIRRRGYPILDQDLADGIALPADVVLHDLLTELIAEGQLTRGFTLLPNGHKAHTYAMNFKP